MHLEVQVALNFVMSYLYNKLPRRRVNIFGEELEKALKAKFDGHWYPEKPCRGSAFRCLKTSNPVDPVLVIAARESGMDLSDIREHLPQDMSVWIDPGEVSFRIGEKGQIKLLMTEKKGPAAFEELTVQLERDGKLVHVAASVFNPETQVFKPVASNVTELAASLATMRVASNSPSTATGPGNHPHPKPQPVFTTAAFAQTKFGSTKLKNSSKRPNRMSPTEFSHYIKQRAMMQQQQRSRQVVIPTPTSTSPIRGFPSSNNSGYPRPRSLSPQDIFGPQDVTYGMPYLPEMNKPPAVGAGISPFPDTTGLWQPPTPGDLIGGFNSSGSASSNSSSGTTTPPLMPMPSSSGGSNGYQNGGGYMGAGSMEPSSAYSDFDAWGSFGNSNNANNNNYHHLLVAN